MECTNAGTDAYLGLASSTLEDGSRVFAGSVIPGGTTHCIARAITPDSVYGVVKHANEPIEDWSLAGPSFGNLQPTLAENKGIHSVPTFCFTDYIVGADTTAGLEGGNDTDGIQEGGGEGGTSSPIPDSMSSSSTGVLEGGWADSGGDTTG